MQPILNSLDVVLQDGFMYSILAMGYYISYSILDFPDLTVEGTVLSGGVVFGLLVKAGVNPYIAVLAAFAAGFLFGGVTGILNVKLKIRPLLCGILVSTALISVNLVCTIVGNGGDFKGDGLSTIDLGRSVPTLTRIFPASELPSDFYGFNMKKLAVFFAMALIFKIITDVFLKTKCGLLLRAAGDNPNYVTMLAKNQGTSKILGLAIGNAYAAVSGALIVQSRGNVNQGIGIGMVVIGLASLIIGLSVFGKVKFMKPTTMVIGGSIIYQASLGIAALLGVPTVYNKIIMAALFTAALIVSGKLKKKRGVERD